MLQKLAAAMLNPRHAARQVYGSTYLWPHNYAVLRHPKAKGPVPQHEPRAHAQVVSRLRKEAYDVREYRIDVDDFRRYLAKAEYSRFPRYCRGGRSRNFVEKSLEHYLAAKLLDINRDETYIDVANDSSPAPEIYAALYGCNSYRQDLKFPAGLHGSRIGGSAAAMPVPDRFAAKMALHCSFEHFEQDADVCFIREAGRVLAHGGRVCILPLYIYTDYAIQTDLAVLPRGALNFDPAAVVYCARGWGNRHGRVYDVPHLSSRIRAALGNLTLTVYVIENEKEVHPSCYVKFVGLFEKVETSSGVA